jgi:hypothetical protein
MKSWLILGAAAVLAGCQRPAGRTLEQFQFLQPGMAITQVVNRVGEPDLEVGYGQVNWIYKLADGSQLNIVPQFNDYTNRVTWRIAYFSQYRGTNLLWTKPPDYK